MHLNLLTVNDVIVNILFFYVFMFNICDGLAVVFSILESSLDKTKCDYSEYSVYVIEN